MAAGTVSGAGPLAALSVLSSAADDTGNDSTATEPATESTTTDTTGTSPTETTPTDTTTTAPVTPTPAGPPTLVSDKDDYNPGETVTLTGENWAPAEVVHIFVNDDEGKTWSRNADVIADVAGKIRDQFQLPTTFVARYSATATGPISGTASTSFTDGNIKVKSASNNHFDYTVQGFASSPSCGGTGGATVTHTADTNGQNESSNNGQSLLITANLNANAPNGSKVFVNWSNPNGLTITPNASSRTICVAGFASGTRDLIGNYATPANTAPTAVNDSYNATEDTTLTVAAPGVLGNDADPDAGDSLSVTATSPIDNVDHGSLTLNSNGSFSYAPAANYCGPDSFAYKAKDSANAESNAATVSISVACVDDPPTIAFTGGATSRNEGESDTYTFSITDVDSTSFTFALGYPTCGTGGSVSSPNLGSSSGSFVCTFADGPASPVVSVQIRDATSASNVINRPVTVSNLPPEITAATSETPIDEGDTSTVTVTANDPAGANDPLAYFFDCDGNNAFEVGPQAGNTHDCLFPDNGNFTVNVRVTDGDGGADNDSTSVVVANVPPSIAISGAANVNEGSSYSLTLGAVSDPGADTVSSYVVHWGDGDTDTYPSNGVKTHTYDDGPADHNITVDLVDEDGTFLDRANDLSVHVNNVPPTVTLAATNTYTWPESASAERTFEYSASDPAGANDPLTMTFDCGTGGVFVAGSGTSSSFKCRFPDGPASPTVSVSANDGDGGVGSDNHAVTVNNVPPTVAKPSFQPVLIACQTSTTLTGISFSDPGANDNPWTVDIDWGDGSTHTNYMTATQGAQPDRTHTYATPGPHTATVSVTDKDGGNGSNTSTAPITVFQYTVDFLPPFDDSTPSGLIVNKMKNGRVVPVKARIRDECAGSLLTDPSHHVTIKVSKTSGTGVGDPIEEYADAGQSSDGTDEFRPSSDFWIYNLDSTALGLVINNMYRVDVYVDGSKATVTNWAVLQPVK